MMATKLAERKAIVRRRKNQERQARRDVRRIHRSCFWTRPLGHVWEVEDSQGYGFWHKRCAGCGWVKTVWDH
jgi:hypothetical protein